MNRNLLGWCATVAWGPVLTHIVLFFWLDLGYHPKAMLDRLSAAEYDSFLSSPLWGLRESLQPLWRYGVPLSGALLLDALAMSFFAMAQDSHRTAFCRPSGAGRIGGASIPRADALGHLLSPLRG